MGSLLIAIGLVPFLTGRMLFTTGLLVSYMLAANIALDTKHPVVTFPLVMGIGVAVTFAVELGLARLKPWARDLVTDALMVPKKLHQLRQRSIPRFTWSKPLSRFSVCSRSTAVELNRLLAGAHVRCSLLKARRAD